MVLGFAEDFSSNAVLDSQLTDLPGSGLYINSGTHPSITIENLLAFLPRLNINIEDWVAGTTYSEYDRDRDNLVTFGGEIYQSLANNNIGNQPDTSPSEWLLTNLDSLRLKHFLDQVQDRVYSDLNLNRRLINNQFLYEVGQDNPQEVVQPGDFAGWGFEAKGSDYITFRINQVALQSNVAGPVNLYVVNQGVLIDTLPINPSGAVSFSNDLNYTFSGPGKWRFVMDSVDVITNGGYLDPVKYDGFTVFTTSGNGVAPQDALYNDGSIGNGLGFNISVYLSSQLYIDNNINEYGDFIRATYELMAFEMFLANSHNNASRQGRIQGFDREMLVMETKNFSGNTIIRRYKNEKKQAIGQLEKTFDSQLSDNKGFTIEMKTI